MAHKNKPKRKYRIFCILALLCIIIFALKYSIGYFNDYYHAAETSAQLQITPAPTPIPANELNPITEVSSATITVTGDVLMHGTLIKAGRDGKEYNFDKYFSYIEDYASDADFAVANLETTLAGTDNGNEYSGYPRFNCPDAIVDSLQDAGFDMLLTANNHCNDTGAYGITRTQEVISEHDLINLGTSSTEDAPKYLVQDVNGIKIGMVCYTYGTIDDDTGKKAVNGIPIHSDATDYVNVFDNKKLDTFYAEMEDHINNMYAEGAEAIVLFIHWGSEYELKPNKNQTAIAQAMCDLGVDVIVGGHPHVIQPVELLSGTDNPEHKTLCIYSVGNAVSNQRASYMKLDTGHTEDGVLFSFTFTKYSNNEVFLDDAAVIPTWTCVRSGDDGKSFDILPLDQDISDWKDTFDISSSAYKKAQASYERTMDLVGEGMDATRIYLEQSKAEREALFIGSEIDVDPTLEYIGSHLEDTKSEDSNSETEESETLDADQGKNDNPEDDDIIAPILID